MPRTIITTLVAAIILTAPAFAKDYTDTIHGIALNDPIEQVQELLPEYCDEIETISPQSTRFPLAQSTETHIICSNFVTPTNEQINQLTLSFADGRLAMIKATAGSTSPELFNTNEQTDSIAHWDIYDNMDAVFDPKTDTLWIINQDAKHAHTFLWSTPTATSNDSQTDQPLSATIPDFLEFGSKLSPISKELKASSIATTRERISPPTLPTQPNRQTQVNAYGFHYAGAHRKLEAVFADGELAMVWILTTQAEEQRIHSALVSAYGDPTFTSDTVEAFNDWSVILRKDKPEVLAIADELVPFMKSFMGG